nr:MAG TPA: hypothetical protein [Caudoviricetes sp.]
MPRTDHGRHQKQRCFYHPIMFTELKYGAGDNDIRYSAIVLVLDFHSAYSDRLCCFEFVTFFHVAVMHGIPLVTPFLRFTFMLKDEAKSSNTALVSHEIFVGYTAALPAIQIRVQWVDGLYVWVSTLKTRGFKRPSRHKKRQIADRCVTAEAFLDAPMTLSHEQRTNRGFVSL